MLPSELYRRQFHHCEGRTTIGSIWIAKRFHHLQMMIVDGFYGLHRLARRFHRSPEVTALALKVWDLQGAICDDDRRIY